MATYYVDDGGSATAPYDTWAKAATSLSALDDAVAFAGGDIVYIGHDHVCQASHSGHRTFTAPDTNSTAPVFLISATTGSDPPVYQASSTKQIDTTEGAYDAIFYGSWSLQGISVSSGRDILFRTYYYYSFVFDGCLLKPANGRSINGASGSFAGQNRMIGCTVDLAADNANTYTAVFGSLGFESFEVSNLNVLNGEYRAVLFQEVPASLSGVNCSSMTRLSDSAGFLVNVSSIIRGTVSNIKTPETWNAIRQSGLPYSQGQLSIVNAGSVDSPWFIAYQTAEGRITSTNAIYRTGGASAEATSFSWLVDTTKFTYVGANYVPFRTPHIYGYIASTGSKTFDLYITNDTADFTDAEVWLEVEYLGTADSAKWERATDQRATITTTAAAQTDDTTSTWVGTGPSFTYKQKLSVTATVNEEGQYRARVCVGVASIASSRYFYIDPKVTVS